MTEPPAAELAVGLEVYGTPGVPCAARIKARDEDFQVEERLKGAQVAREPLPGYFPVYRVRKRSIDTIHMAGEMAQALKSRVSYAGMKDKSSLSIQYVTPTSSRAERPERVERDKFTAELVGYVPRPLTKGMAAGNLFVVVMRQCCEGMSTAAREVLELAGQRLVPNFYGLQRFGARGMLTHRIGKRMIKGDFEGAVKAILSDPRASDDERLRSARKAMEDGRLVEGYGLLTPGQDVERRVARHLVAAPADHLGALREVPISVRRLYTQAYQSYVFNRTLSLVLQRGLDISRYESGDNWGEESDDGLALERVHGVRESPLPRAAPLIQFAGYAYRNYGSRFDSCLEEVLKDEEVRPGEFYVKQMQEVSVEGGFRRPYITVREPQFSAEDDTATLKFALGRGEYATILLREIVKPADPFISGFA